MNDGRSPQVSQLRQDVCKSAIGQDENLDKTLSLSSGDSTSDLGRTDPNHHDHDNDTSHSPSFDEANIPSNLGRANVEVEEYCTEQVGVGNGYYAKADKKNTASKSTATDPTSTIPSSSQASPSRINIDTSKYPSSCIVNLSAEACPGDQLTIRWPTIEQNECSTQDGTEKASKRLRSDDSPDNADSDVLVKITLPGSIKSKKNKTCHIKVFAPWIAANHAAANTLTSRQLRSIGIDGHENCNIDLRRSRQQHLRNHGEGQFYERQPRIGDRYQVSATNIPSSDTWANDQLSRNESTPGNDEAAAKCNQIWDTALSAEANSHGEPVYRYIDSLSSFQKMQGMMELHQSAYKVSTEGLQASQSTLDTSFIHTTEPEAQTCQSSQTMLEGKPFSPKEKETFHAALEEYRKQWPKVAQAVGTSVNRCLIYYYSTYKTGEGRDNYLANKKVWEQSDECEICHDGGDLICCDGCINSYHLSCISPTMKEVPPGVWLCPLCEKLKEEGNKE